MIFLSASGHAGHVCNISWLERVTLKKVRVIMYKMDKAHNLIIINDNNDGFFYVLGNQL